MFVREPAFDPANVPHVIDMVTEVFGAIRLMLGIDYPPCSYREEYAKVVF